MATFGGVRLASPLLAMALCSLPMMDRNPSGVSPTPASESCSDDFCRISSYLATRSITTPWMGTTTAYSPPSSLRSLWAKGTPLLVGCTYKKLLSLANIQNAFCTEFISSVGSNPTITTAPVRQRSIYQGCANGLSRGSVRLQSPTYNVLTV